MHGAQGRPSEVGHKQGQDQGVLLGRYWQGDIGKGHWQGGIGKGYWQRGIGKRGEGGGAYMMGVWVVDMG